MLEQGEQAAGDGVARGVVAGDHDQEVEGEELELRDGLAVERRIGQHGREVVARVGAAIGGDLEEERERLLQKSQARLAGVALALELGILDTEVLVGHAQDEVLLVARNAEHLGDHAKRLAGRDVGDEVALVGAAVARELVEDLGRDLLEPRL